MLAHVSDQLRMALGDIHTSHGSGFLASRAGAWLMIYVIPECDVNADWPEHPLFDKLTGKDWGALSYKHFRHHLKQFAA